MALGKRSAVRSYLVEGLHTSLATSITHFLLILSLLEGVDLIFPGAAVAATGTASSHFLEVDLALVGRHHAHTRLAIVLVSPLARLTTGFG